MIQFISLTGNDKHSPLLFQTPTCVVLENGAILIQKDPLNPDIWEPDPTDRHTASNLPHKSVYRSVRSHDNCAEQPSSLPPKSGTPAITTQKFSGNITDLYTTVRDNGQTVRTGTFNGYADDGKSDLLACSIIADTDEELALLGLNKPRNHVTIEGIYKNGYLRPTAPTILHYNDPKEVFVRSGEIFSIIYGLTHTKLGHFIALKDITLHDVTAAYDLAFPNNKETPSARSLMTGIMEKAELMSPTESGAAVTTLHIDPCLSFPCTFSRIHANKETEERHDEN